MRDMNQSYLNFTEHFNKQLERKFSIIMSKDIKILRSAVIDNPTFFCDFDLILPRKYKEIRGIIIILDKLPEILRYEILLCIEERILSFDFKKQVELRVLLDQKTKEKYLYYTQRYTSHEIFGVLIQEAITSLLSIKLYKKNKKVKKPQRKRGYDDKGTLRSYDIWQHNWKPSSDWSLNDLQNQIERQITLREKYLSRIIKFIENKLN